MDARPSRERRMLLVEDDEELRTVLSRAAARSIPDLVVDWASDLRTARDRLQRGHYDAVLVDYCLGPQERGDRLYPVCAHHQPAACFAVMSARPLEELLRLAPGRDLPLLPKPFTTEEFGDFVHSLLDRAA